MHWLDGAARQHTAETVARSFWRPAHLGVSVSALVVALVLAGSGVPVAAAGIALTGIVAHAGLTAVDLSRRPGALRLPAAPGPEEIEAPDLRALYDGIVVKGGQLRSLLPPDSDLVLRCRELVRQAGLAARRANRVYAYLQGETQASIQADASALEARATRTGDSPAAHVFTEAAVLKLQQLETREQLQGMFDCTLARLSLIEASFDAMRAKLVRLEAVASEDAADVTDDVPDHLEALDADVRLLEDAVACETSLE